MSENHELSHKNKAQYQDLMVHLYRLQANRMNALSTAIYKL